ncbi:RHS repeat-associated core domain-containing protein [Flavobacterium baculatum]|uniref:RHS repeat-associated core domain-containing protein n=1 Tax=Paenimyroides baculatum TaxID=2608000 RepID=A0A5M6CMB1_9FLAO|nr:hypothetical protein F0460_07250 [Paenimyroides baculatum]
MYYYGARYYDPRISIFVSVDPSAERYSGWTPYHYVHNNPIIYTDPNGKDAILIIKGNNITVKSNIYIYGSGATKTTASIMRSNIMKKWGTNNGKAWTYTDPQSGKVYNVNFEVSVSVYKGNEKSNPLVIPQSWDPDNMDNFIEVGATLDEVGRSYVSGGDEGVWRGMGRNGKSLADDDAAPHEFAHLLGLDDRYSDEGGAYKGWENNIMGNAIDGNVDQRNIDSIVKDGVNRVNSIVKELKDWRTRGKGKLNDDALEYRSSGRLIYKIDVPRPNK